MIAFHDGECAQLTKQMVLFSISESTFMNGHNSSFSDSKMYRRLVKLPEKVMGTTSC